MPVYNPASDATPAEPVDYLATETGVHEQPFDRRAFDVERSVETAE